MFFIHIDIVHVLENSVCSTHTWNNSHCLWLLVFFLLLLSFVPRRFFPCIRFLHANAVLIMIVKCNHARLDCGWEINNECRNMHMWNSWWHYGVEYTRCAAPNKILPAYTHTHTYTSIRRKKQKKIKQYFYEVVFLYERKRYDDDEANYHGSISTLSSTKWRQHEKKTQQQQRNYVYTGLRASVIAGAKN